MTGSAVVAIGALGLFIAWLAYMLLRDMADWRRTQRRGVRRVPPRPAQTPDWDWPTSPHRGARR